MDIELEKRETTIRKETQAKINPFIHRKLNNTRIEAYMFYSGHLIIKVKTADAFTVSTVCR